MRGGIAIAQTSENTYSMLLAVIAIWCDPSLSYISPSNDGSYLLSWSINPFIIIVEHWEMNGIVKLPYYESCNYVEFKKTQKYHKNNKNNLQNLKNDVTKNK